MSKEDCLELTGVVIDCHKGANFDVELTDVPDAVKGMIVNCTLPGKMRTNYIKILKGDNVTIEVSPYDLTKGRITWRNK